MVYDDNNRRRRHWSSKQTFTDDRFVAFRSSSQLLSLKPFGIAISLKAVFVAVATAVATATPVLLTPSLPRLGRRRRRRPSPSLKSLGIWMIFMQQRQVRKKNALDDDFLNGKTHLKLRFLFWIELFKNIGNLPSFSHLLHGRSHRRRSWYCCCRRWCRLDMMMM